MQILVSRFLFQRFVHLNSSISVWSINYYLQIKRNIFSEWNLTEKWIKWPLKKVPSSDEEAVISFICNKEPVFFWMTLLCLIAGKKRSNEMHQGENYQDFLKQEGVVSGYSLIIIRWIWGFLFLKFAIFAICPVSSPLLPTIRHERVLKKKSSTSDASFIHQISAFIQPGFLILWAFGW